MEVNLWDSCRYFFDKNENLVFDFIFSFLFAALRGNFTGKSLTMIKPLNPWHHRNHLFLILSFVENRTEKKKRKFSLLIDVDCNFSSLFFLHSLFLLNVLLFKTYSSFFCSSRLQHRAIINPAIIWRKFLHPLNPLFISITKGNESFYFFRSFRGGKKIKNIAWSFRMNWEIKSI